MKKNLMKSGAFLGIGALLLTASCKKEVAPGFTPSATEVAIGESVSFTDNEEQRKNASYFWDFGDKSKSFDRNPSHIYTKAGTYIVSQTVSLDKNAEKGKNLKASSQATITVTGPTANFTTDKASYATGEPIVIKNTSTSSDKGSVVSYDWRYVSTNGNSGFISSNKDIAAQSFNTAGIYTIILTTEQGETQSTKSIDIAIGGGTTSAFTRSMIIGSWKFTSDETVVTGSTGAGGCPTSSSNTNIPTTVNFEHDGNLTEYFPTGNQTTGNTGNDWWLSSDGKFLTYDGSNNYYGSYSIKTISASSLVLERVIIEDWGTTCGTAIKSVRTVTFTK